MNNDESANLLKFIHQSEGLKRLLRHSWLSDGRRESVAEHTWRMMLMALLLHDKLDENVNLSQVLKICLVHDLPEVITTDYPAFKKQPDDKVEQEEAALQKMTGKLPKNTRNEIVSLWQEYEAGSTPEARFTKALDKLEVLIQHNESDISKQTDEELPFNLYYGNKFTDYDKFLERFRSLVRKETLCYYEKNNVDKKKYSAGLSITK